MSIVKIGWSGGKDSTCAVMEHIKRGDKVKAVCWLPMLTKKIPLILKDHYEFIIKTAERYCRMGDRLITLKWKNSNRSVTIERFNTNVKELLA